MTRFYKIISAIAILLVAQSAFAQYKPLAFQDFNLPQAPVFDVGTYDLGELLTMADKFENEEGRTMNGRILYFDEDANSIGAWSTLDDGTQVWRAQFHSDNAKSISVYFDNMHIPYGAQLFIYNPDLTYFEGPIDYRENNDHGNYVTNDIWGEDIILEYIQPSGVIGSPTLEMNGASHFFRYVYDPLDQSRGSDPCEVDVNCPEGDDWQCQRDAAVRLRITDDGGNFLCSGSMVNTTALDCRQYMLTALHCADGVDDEEMTLLQVKFNFESADCGTGSVTNSHNRTGVFHLADSNDGGGNSGSDFLLVEIEDEIADSWAPYFAGWDVSGNGGNEGVSIHHPAGDRKKISTYDSSLGSVWIGAPGSHWEVNWIETETNHGVTEGGSSGSPIFNQNKLIVGTLTGGSSFCNTPNAPDYYGKMSYHWSNNPNSADQKLSQWLDPTGSGIEVLWGAYRPCNAESSCNPLAIEEEYLNISNVVVSPNPTEGNVLVTVPQNVTLEQVMVYDGSGRLITTNIANGSQNLIDMSSFSKGLYYVTIVTELGNQFTQKVIKE